MIQDGHKVVPLPLVDVEVLVRGGHVAARVNLRPAREVAHDLDHEELETRALRALVPTRDELVVAVTRRGANAGLSAASGQKKGPGFRCLDPGSGV